MNIINKIAVKIIGSSNQRLLKKLNKTVETINKYSTEYQNLTNEELQNKTVYLKNKLADGESLDDILPEAFATVRETSDRIIGLRHYDVQLLGGIILHQGKISEMGTGEGKTLVATLPAYLNALDDNGVHVVTVNDYLAKRDTEWMEGIFKFLGLSVGVIVANLSPEDRQEAYKCDVVYATNNELGFDYLRDNMAFSIQQKVQRKLNFAIIDEVDSILIDEARTPLIISGPADDYSQIYKTINNFIGKFSEQKEVGQGKELIVEVEGDYTVEEKHKQILITDRGHSKAEELLKKNQILEDDESLYDAKNILLTQHLNSALRAHVLFKKDVDYIVQDDEIIIVDEFTGRTMIGRRWSEGLHQAIEAKENVSIKKENQTLASITFQNYFRLYNKLSGMTGTAYTEAYELESIYGLMVVIIPPNKQSKRQDFSDMIYLTSAEKYNAIYTDIKECLSRGQPVLVGTSSIESSELLSSILSKNKINHEVLNAKQHEREAQIIANAGKKYSITIATNMAGRGTDIVLGGKLSEDSSEQDKKNWNKNHNDVIACGGLRIVGTERNESRRVDNQLRGRTARQGDIGSTRFYLSLEDNLMRIFASDRMASMMSKLGMKENESIEHNMVNRAIENAQKKVEGYNFDARKQLLEYDNVSNDQRRIVYKKRDDLMLANDVSDNLKNMRYDVINNIFYQYINISISDSDWDISGLHNILKSDFSIDIDIKKYLDDDIKINDLSDLIITKLVEVADEKEQLAGSDTMRDFEKSVMLQTLDHFWKEHLSAMDYLRQSIGLRGYAQKNPVQEYKNEAFKMFNDLLENINLEIIKIISNVSIKDNYTNIKQQKQQDMHYEHQEVNSLGNNENSNNNKEQQKPFVRPKKKIGRNEPCHCGSGKKFKQCHGKA